MEAVYLDHEFAGYNFRGESKELIRFKLTFQTVFIATASLLFLSDKFQFNPEAVSLLS